MLYPDIPIMNSNTTEETRQSFLETLIASKARRLWIALDRSSLFDRGDSLKRMEANIRFFEGHGFETGVWMQAFGFGDPLTLEQCGWTRIHSVEGQIWPADAFCPEDPDFMKAYLKWVEDIAKLGPRLIMLDDDLCLSVRPGIGCFCERHMALMEEKLGEKMELDQIFVGGKNKYRDVWYEVVGNTLREFCRKVRATVDGVDKSIRVGLCAGYTSWDIEGTDPIEMSRILAGNTRPFFRLTGAPYWVSPILNRFPGQRLGSVIECARNQIAWCKDTDIEILAEADSYPRPCYHVPAMLIENFDLAMHAEGVHTLKYILDYHSSPDYERQYEKVHVRNLPFYDVIEKAFHGKEACGVRLYRPMHRITDSILPEEYIGQYEVMRRFFSPAAAMLSGLGIPVCYDGESECAAVFGDDALYFEPKHEKVLLDLPAALLLQERGMDVGIVDAKKGPVPSFEFFEDEKTLLFNAQGEFFDVELKEGAKVMSRFNNGAPSCFAYKNFMVLTFDSATVGESSTVFCSYARQKQLLTFFDASFPVITGVAGIYSLCAGDQNKQAVLFENLSIDPIYDCCIQLPWKCNSFSLYGAEGYLEGDAIRLTTEVVPSSSILLEIEYEG